MAPYDWRRRRIIFLEVMKDKNITITLYSKQHGTVDLLKTSYTSASSQWGRTPNI